jgi:hypothetical protein
VAWKAGHKHTCGNPHNVTCDVKEEIAESALTIIPLVQSTSVCSAVDGLGVAVVMRDSNTGQLFESLTNQDVVFKIIDSPSHLGTPSELGPALDALALTDRVHDS